MSFILSRSLSKNVLTFSENLYKKIFFRTKNQATFCLFLQESLQNSVSSRMNYVFLCSDNQNTHIMIRPVTLQDAPDIVAIYNEYIAHSTITFDMNPLTAQEMQQRYPKSLNDILISYTKKTEL